MKYIVYLILIVTFPLTGEPAAAADRYRVEVLVLKHLQGSQEAKEMKTIKDYSGALDFLAPEPEPDELNAGGCEPAAETDTAGAGAPLGDEPPLDGLPEEEAEVEIDPNAVVHVEEMGAEMQDAWRRLRLSGPFRPLQFLAWEQGSDEPFPELRLHDQDVVMLDDPWADLRDTEVYGDEYGYDDPAADEADCIQARQPIFPDPTLYYALDGTVSLKRSRFLHLNFDLQLREALALARPLPSETLPAVLPAGSSAATGDAVASGQPASFLVHKLEQSRQVRSSRMEYFDGPVISVLAWITTIPLEESTER